MYVFSFSYAGKGVQRKAVPSCLRKAGTFFRLAAKLCEGFTVERSDPLDRRARAWGGGGGGGGGGG